MLSRRQFLKRLGIAISTALLAKVPSIPIEDRDADTEIYVVRFMGEHTSGEAITTREVAESMAAQFARGELSIQFWNGYYTYWEKIDLYCFFPLNQWLEANSQYAVNLEV